MSATDWALGMVVGVRDSAIFHGAVTGGTVIAVAVCALALLTLLSYLLHRFFRTHAWITSAHRFLVYLLTMAGVIILLLGGVLGFFLPIIPGFLLILLGMLLLRRYYKNRWVEKNIRWLRFKLRLKKEVKRLHKHLHAVKAGKHLRTKRKAHREGDDL